MDDDEKLRGANVMQARVLGESRDLVRIVQQAGVQDLVVAITNTDAIKPELMEALIGCWSLGVDVVPMPLYYEHLTGAVPAQHLGQNLFALAGVSTGLGLRLWDVFRRAGDVVVGAVGLLFAGVLLPVIALAIMVDSRGGVFYRQERVGKGGRSCSP